MSTNLNMNINKWINFLCSKNNFHNLCISYPLQIEQNQYTCLHTEIHNQMINSLQLHTKNSNNASFINSDLLVFDQKESSITSKDLEIIDSFTNSHAHYLPCKIIIIWGPKNLSAVLSNKILKLLEDPPVPLSFIFLGYSYAALLPTIRSRFLNWRIHLNHLNGLNLAHSLHTPPWQEFKNSDDFEKWATDNDLSCEQCLNFLWQNILQGCSSASKIERLMSFQQWFERSQLWNNPVSERWYFLFQMAKNSLQYKLQGTIIK